MFSQFRNAVESFSNPHPSRPAPVRTGSQDITSPQAAAGGQAPRGSLDLTGVTKSISLSTGHLAESALLNLRKSLVAQRPLVAASSSENTSPQPEKELRPLHKTTLEERLRATFTIGETSAVTTEANSHVPSPSPFPLPHASDVQPSAIPLPLSPPSPSTSFPNDIAAPTPITADSLRSVDERLMQAVADGPSRLSDASHTFHAQEILYPEADIPLPPSPMPLPEIAIEDLDVKELAETEHENLDSTGESLKEQLRQKEQQLLEMSNSFKLLQDEKDAANEVLRELTPVSSISEAAALREHLRHTLSHNEEELQRLNNRLRTYDERIVELRDMHLLESRSQSQQIDSLRKQLDEAEAQVSQAKSANSKSDDDAKQRKAEMDSMRAEVDKANGVAKEEEEKRVKAISLLKTVRQKLVKAEKERDDALRDVQELKIKDNQERAKAQTEKAALEAEIESVRAQKERDIAGLKAHFDQELNGMKDKLEKEYAARKGQLELENLAAKNTHQKELLQRNTRISSLESSVQSLGREKDALFDQLQLRQAEVESVQSQLAVMQNNTAELQFQLHESTERVGLLVEELEEARRAQEYRIQRPPPSPARASSSFVLLENKYEAQIAELRTQLIAAETERNEAEVVLNRTLEQKLEEIEALKSLIAQSIKLREENENEISRLHEVVEKLRQDLSFYRVRAEDAEKYNEGFSEIEATLKRQHEASARRIEQSDKELHEVKEREVQLRSTIKGIRDELRKVQASAALLERQRNPGVGYWSSTPASESTSDIRSASPSSVGSPDGKSVTSKADEEVNLEYLRNVILQFLEHKEMRPNLVRVLSIILHFTPQETRRLIAKV